MSVRTALGFSRNLMALVSIAAASARVAAQTPSSISRLTIGEAVRIALGRNPDVVIAQLRVDSARGDRRAVGAPANPSLNVIPGNPTQYTVSEPVDLFARHYRVASGQQGVAAAQLDRADAARQVTFGVRLAFLDLLLADSLRTVAGEQTDVLRQLLFADSVRLRIGDVAESDVVTTELAYAHAEAARTRAAASVRAARIALQALLGATHLDTSLAVEGELSLRSVAAADSLQLAPLQTAALEQRPDVAAAAVRVRQSAALVSLARASLAPLPIVGLSWQPATPFGSGSHFAPAVGVQLPLLYQFGGERARANAGLAAARVNAARARWQAESDAATALDALRSSGLLARRYDSGLLVKARRSVETARYAYGHGALSLLDLLNAIRGYADTRADYQTALHDYWAAAYAIDRAVGRDVLQQP